MDKNEEDDFETRFEGVDRHPKHIFMSEVMPEPEESTAAFRKRFYKEDRIEYSSKDLGYEPRFPTGRMEERLRKMNEIGGPLFSPPAEPMHPENEPQNIYRRLNREMGPEPLGGDKPDDAA